MFVCPTSGLFSFSSFPSSSSSELLWSLLSSFKKKCSLADSCSAVLGSSDVKLMFLVLTGSEMSKRFRI